MTATLELQRPKLDIPSVDEALEIIDRYRDEMEERFRVKPLEVEFPRLSQQLGRGGIYLAKADDNLAGAFKWRGAIIGATKLKEEGFDSLVVPSAGNHARGAILAAKALGMAIHVVVPRTAPPAKKEGLKELWDSPRLTVHAIGETFDESLQWANDNPELGALLHPYDDPYVIAGSGTLAHDILASARHPEKLQHIVGATGGFGLLPGIADALKQLGRTDITTHAVEAVGSNSLSKSTLHDRLVAADSPNSRFGGSAVKKIGSYGFAMYRELARSINIASVEDREVEVIADDYDADRHDRIRLDTPNYEPTTLVALAGLRHIIDSHPSGDIVVIGSGHNEALHSSHSSRSNTRVSAGTFPK